jgi:hypothetical protein
VALPGKRSTCGEIAGVGMHAREVARDADETLSGDIDG